MDVSFYNKALHLLHKQYKTTNGRGWLKAVSTKSYFVSDRLGYAENFWVFYVYPKTSTV